MIRNVGTVSWDSPFLDSKPKQTSQAKWLAILEQGDYVVRYRGKRSLWSNEVTMPIYVLRCRKCNHKEELTCYSISQADDIIKHHKCKGCETRGLWEKIPTRTSWMWGEKIKDKG